MIICLKKAKKLLAEAGYPDGFKTEVLCTTYNDTDLIQVVAGYFQEIGVEMDISVQDPGAFESYLVSGKAQQMSVAPRGNHSDIPAVPKVAYYTSFHRHQATTGLSDPNMDELYGKCASAPTEEEIQPLLVQADRYITEQQWQVSLLPIVSYFVRQPWVMGETPAYRISPGALHARMWLDLDLKKTMGY